MFNSIFDGRVVAKLPFTPIYWIQGLSHRNLLGDDMTDCSSIFLYILCTMSIRQNIQKALGFAPSRAASKQVTCHAESDERIVCILVTLNTCLSVSVCHVYRHCLLFALLQRNAFMF